MSPEIQLAGIHPRSEKLIELTRLYERARTSWNQVGAQLEHETRELIKLQESLSFRHFSDGALGWQDQLRPIARSLKGVESGTRYSRWFDTNTFYQKPVVTGEISLGEYRPGELIRSDLSSTSARWKVVLPGPYTFSELSESKFNQDKNDLILSVARAEKELIRSIVRSHVSLVQLTE